MATHNRGYYREQRNRHIRRKKRIDKEVHRNLFAWYPHDGQYSKGKIHCSCPLCRGKDIRGRHIKTLQEQKSDDDIENQIDWYSWIIDDIPIGDYYYPVHTWNDGWDIDWEDAFVEDVTVNGIPLDGQYFKKLIDFK